MSERFMRRALELAERGLGRTSPNPAVGAVVVREGVIVGEGYHRRAGEPHAERIALGKAGEAARNADLYVTLEPCCHHGRTPPCTDAIVEAGVARVFYAVPDPDQRCPGGGHAVLERAGIEVHAGLLQRQAERMLQGYIRHRRTGRPLVTLKLAMSLDGKIATRTGDSRWITCEQSRRLVHQMRDRADAVMVGAGTVAIDDPALTTRLVEGRDALRVICDSAADTDPAARVVRQQSEAGCLIAASRNAPESKVAALEEAGAEVLALSEAGGGCVDLRELMDELGDRGVLSVLVEGGGRLAWEALSAGVVDKVAFFYAPIIIGGEGAVGAVRGMGVERVGEALELRDVSVRRVGRDLLVEGYLTPESELTCSRG
ncbi:MAG: bifunctional diaminohydroxyphosphoribosylaminopyrimidine deaminase/5-amino-6-(5-phosphoribosylamino)uracil reductase RibD [Armatimonadota bacterium]|nr:bifunctional diaminohydroxyphosphoribosylaminopyrimidine deaminase/5-amino-6-(5-phosphoribosylamino)uracil reductase RibD [Armatimonadota bacterium]